MHEVKFDGYRLQLRVEHHRAALRTRKGLDWTARFPGIAADARALPDCLLDGEAVALNQEGASDFAKLQAALSEQRTDKLVFFAFDVLFLDGRDLRDAPLAERKRQLEAVLKKFRRHAKRLRYVPHFRESGAAMLDAACRMKLEGIISKRLDSAYRSGRNADWLKTKCRGGQEVVIGGWWGDRDHLRSLLVGVRSEGGLRYMGRVGTGFNAGNARELLKSLKPFRRATSPFANKADVPRTGGISWVEPKLVAEVAFGSITEAGLLRQASYKGLRQDKPARDVIAEPQPAAAPRRSTSPVADESDTLDIEGVSITNARKILWPAEGEAPAVTKADLARYYASVASRMLPHIADRPLSLVRAPNGIDDKQIFQRHAPAGTSRFVLDIPVRGESRPFMGVHSRQALLALAQAAVVEIHPWGSAKDKPEIPERIVFDLDPAPDVPFSSVISAARAMRARLRDCGLTPFLKTTGGKGLHVVVAVKGNARTSPTWDEAKAFARSVCQSLESDAPNLYTTNISKHARTGRIFLDYLRNGRMATAVAPYSPRARPHAPIALPIPWSALRPELDPSRFTIATATALLRRADPWKDIGRSARSLRDSVRALEG